MSAAAGSEAPDHRLGVRTYVVERDALRVLRIGREDDNDILVADLTASRHHAEIRPSPHGGLEVVDLGSSNGTFVNGRRVQRALLHELDLVTVGNHAFRLVGEQLEAYEDDHSIGFAVEDLRYTTEDGTPLLQGVSFHLGERSFLGVLGPSGSGKSTLLGALTGRRRANQGRVTYGSRDLYADYEALRGRIGFVPQDDILHLELTVEEELRYAASLRFAPDTSAAERGERIDAVLDELDLAPVRTRPITRLSGGQRKRVSVAVELLTQPGLLFLDEPTSGLDPGYERSLMTLLRQLADGGRIVVVITHAVQSIRLCDRVLVLAPGGRMAFFGPPQLAATHFGESDLEDVFILLSNNPERDWPGLYAASENAALEKLTATFVPLVDPSAPEVTPARPAMNRVRQFRLLVARNLAVLRADRRTLLLLLLQGPLLGLVLLVALPTGQLDQPGPLEVRLTSRAALVLLLLVLGSTWLGAINAVREIVKELPILVREQAAGLSVSAYIAAKATVLAAVTVVGVVPMVLLGTLRQGGPSDAIVLSPGRLELIVAIAMAGLAAMALGLLLSASVPTTDRAMTLLPAVLILQMVLAVGAVFPEVTDHPGLEQASQVSSANWGMSAAGSTADLNALQGVTVALSRLPPLNLAEPEQTLAALGSTAQGVLGAGDDRFDHERAVWLQNMAALAALTVVPIMAAAVVLRRRVAP